MVKALLELSRFNLELFFKTYVAVLFTYLMPSALFIAIIAKAQNKSAMVEGLTPLFVGLIILFVSFYTLGSQAVAYREMGFYKRILVTRIGSVAISLSNVMLGFALVLIGLLVLTLEAFIIFQIRPAFNVLSACTAILIAGTGIFMLGLIPALFVKRTQSMFAIASVGVYITTLFSGTIPDTGKWTKWLHFVSLASPSFHALRILRAGFSGNLLSAPLATSLVYTIIFVVCCLLIFRRYLTWI